MMRRPWAVGVEVPGEVIGEGRYGRAAGVVPLEWWGAPGRRHAVRTVIKLGHDGAAATPGSAGSPRFAWTSR